MFPRAMHRRRCRKMKEDLQRCPGPSLSNFPSNWVYQSHDRALATPTIAHGRGPGPRRRVRIEFGTEAQAMVDYHASNGDLRARWCSYLQSWRGSERVVAFPSRARVGDKTEPRCFQRYEV